MVWGYCGPLLITDHVRSYCFGNENSTEPLKSCKDITILPTQAIQPVYWEEIPNMFKPQQEENSYLQFQKVRINCQGLCYALFFISSRLLEKQLEFITITKYQRQKPLTSEINPFLLNWPNNIATLFIRNIQH